MSQPNSGSNSSGGSTNTSSTNTSQGAASAGAGGQTESKTSGASNNTNSTQVANSKQNNEAASQEVKKYKFKTKVKDQEEEREYTEDEVVKHLQKGKYADSVLQQAREAQKAIIKEKQELEQLKKLASENPDEFFKKFNIPSDVARQNLAKKLADEYEESIMSPQDRELKTLRAEKAESERLKKEQEEKVKKEADEKALIEKQQEYVNKLLETVSKDPFFEGFDANANEADAAIGQHLYGDVMRILAQENVDGVEPLTVEQVYQDVIATYQNFSKKLLTKLSGEKLREFLGEELIDKIRKDDIERLNKPTQTFKPKEEKVIEANRKDSTNNKMYNEYEWLKQFERK